MNNNAVKFLSFAVTAFVIVLGYKMLGALPSVLFSFGFFGGYMLWLWKGKDKPFKEFRLPYFLALFFFVIHKLEERYMDFFPALSKITKVPVPDISSPLVYILYACGTLWLLIPFLAIRRYTFGYYLAWTFFASMGITEVAHFIFPFFTDQPYGYFPGMASAALLAPVGWWGMYRLSKS